MLTELQQLAFGLHHVAFWFIPSQPFKWDQDGKRILLNNSPMFTTFGTIFRFHLLLHGVVCGIYAVYCAAFLGNCKGLAHLFVLSTCAYSFIFAWIFEHSVLVWEGR